MLPESTRKPTGSITAWQLCRTKLTLPNATLCFLRNGQKPVVLLAWGGTNEEPQPCFSSMLAANSGGPLDHEQLRHLCHHLDHLGLQMPDASQRGVAAAACLVLLSFHLSTSMPRKTSQLSLTSDLLRPSARLHIPKIISKLPCRRENLHQRQPG